MFQIKIIWNVYLYIYIYKYYVYIILKKMLSYCSFSKSYLVMECGHALKTFCAFLFLKLN